MHDYEYDFYCYCDFNNDCDSVQTYVFLVAISAGSIL